MTRDEAIEAGARAIHAASGMATEWDVLWPANRDWYRASAAAVLDAIGWDRITAAHDQIRVIHRAEQARGGGWICWECAEPLDGPDDECLTVAEITRADA